ncbi:hypothetical protein [uncultured Sphingopyxis sp.]|uniref:hypothetical protein n=1 Tax=uncultured Sphingopyxis sp. TaxID=310581 RepID=UPI00259816D0|nr:hypothetical protein [uncultured Sphingopyxis sp.]
MVERNRSIRNLKEEIASTLQWRWEPEVGGPSHPPPIQTERYRLYFDDADEVFITKSTEAFFLECSLQHRIIMARGERHAPHVADLKFYKNLVPFSEIHRKDLLSKALAYSASFMAIRNHCAAPYYRALSYQDPIEIDVQTARFRSVKNLVSETWIVSVDESGGIRSENLDEKDRALISAWNSGRVQAKDQNEKQNSRARKSIDTLILCYARLAEKLVINFYRAALQREPVDVSAQQLGGDLGSKAWMSHDVYADRAIDVKNATSFHSCRRHNYISKFKSINDSEVAIAGVVSKPRVRHGSVQQRFLGICTERSLNAVQSAINGLSGRQQALELTFYERTLPPWAFELEHMNPDFQLLHSVASIISWNAETVLATALAVGEAKNSRPYTNLTVAQRDIVDRFAMAIEEAGYSKATIYLFALSEFIDRVLLGKDTAAFLRFFRKIISIEDFRQKTMDHKRYKYEISLAFRGSSCGGLYDPLNSIDECLHLLELAGNNIASSGLSFKGFSAANPHTLIGRTTDDQYVTVFAYCGGLSKAGAPCNKFPLVIFENLNCFGCGRLICDECQFCSQGCKEGEQRQSAI